MSLSPKVLLVTHRVKDYWASDLGRARIHTAITPAVLRWSELFEKRTRVGQYFMALYACSLASGFDAVVCVDRHLALAFGMLKRLTKARVATMAHQFILPDEIDSRRKPLAASWDRAGSRALDRIVVNSAHEAAIYARRLNAEGRVVFVPLAVEPAIFEIESNPGRRVKIFSGGAAMRDYPTLFQAVRDLDVETEVVVYSPESLASPGSPACVDVRYQLPFREFLQRMASAQLVVIPLRNTERAAGQMTVVLAQAMGCAVVASDIPSLRDYITHGVNGWLVPAGDGGRLRKAIETLLADSTLRLQVAANARMHALTQYTYARYDQRMGQVIDEALQSTK